MISVAPRFGGALYRGAPRADLGEKSGSRRCVVSDQAPIKNEHGG